MFKNIAIVIGAMIITAGIGFVLPYIMSDQTVGVQIDEVAMKEQFKTELIAQVEKELLAIDEAAKISYEDQWDKFVEANPEYLTKFINDVNGVVEEETEVEESEEEVVAVEEAAEVVDEADDVDEEVEVVEDSDDAAAVVEKEDDESLGQADQEGETDESSDELALYEIESIPGATEGKPITEAVVKDAWVNQKISENREEIADADLYSGAGIYDKLDTDYLFGLATDGLTAEEEADAKAYLANNLSESELSIAIDLYNKYVHLLQ